MKGGGAAQRQYRGFTSFEIFNSNHRDVVLLIHMKPDLSRLYNFYLRGRMNFQRNYNTWLFVQGVGMGLVLVVLLLTLIMTARLRYKVDWLYLILVFISGLNISYITGLGSQFTARFLPWISSPLWVFALGLSNLFSILFIEEFTELSPQYKYTRYYFRILKVSAVLLLLAIPLVERNQVFVILNISTIVFLVLILAGLVRLIKLKTKQAVWLFTGWLLFVLCTSFGYLLRNLLTDSQSSAVIFYIIGQALLLIFLGTALIKQVDEQRKKESLRRQSAEHVVDSVIKRMGDQKRMADLGSMVSSVTHELGTPLGVAVTLSSNISNTSRNINELFRQNELSEDDFSQFLTDLLESSELIEKNMENARTLIDGFKQVASDQAAPDIRELNLKEYVSLILRMIKTQFRRSPYRLVLSMSEDLTLITIPGILTQVLMNLINNALTHGFSGREEGEIIISAEKTGTPGNESVVIRVIDNGVGIPPDIQGRIFDMYFTTKKGFGGTGIGLSIVKSLVEERLMGVVAMVSEEGKGTTFTIKLPVNLKELV